MRAASSSATSGADDEDDDDGASVYTSISGVSSISVFSNNRHEASVTSDDDLEKSYRSRFSRLQRQVLNSDIVKMNRKMDEMRGKDAQLKKKFMELQQKRLLLDLDLGDSPTMDTSKSKRDPVEPLLASFMLPPLAIGESIGSVPNAAPGGTTDAPSSLPVPPPRRRGRTPKAKKIMNSGRKEPYPTPEKGKVKLERVLTTLSPMRNSHSFEKSTKSRTPCQELAELTKTLVLRSATKNRAPIKPQLQNFQPKFAQPFENKDFHQDSIRSVSSDPGSLRSLDADVSSIGQSQLAETSSSSCDVTHNVTQWSLFDVTYNHSKNNVKKKNSDADKKQKRGLRRNKSGNKIFPAVSLTSRGYKETRV